MTEHTEILTPEGRPFDWAAFHQYDEPAATRFAGWIPERQRIFLQAVSEGHSVTHACRIVGLSKQSAYAFRNSARGAAFALGWKAAVLRQRDALADELMDRALNGVRETVERDDGSMVTRHRHDNRLAMAMLTRIDRAADATANETGHAAARLIAQDFEQYLDLLGRDAGPARAGMFLGARLDPAARPASDEELAPIRALARADRWLRTRTDLADAVDASDLDPARRAEWSAEQWARAEAAGLVVLAPAPPPQPDSRDGNGQDGQPSTNPDNPDNAPVWWSSILDQWRTRFPPPPGFYGRECGAFGMEDYSRELSPAEEEVMDAPYLAEVEARRQVEGVERDDWFGFVPEEAPDAEEEDWDDEDWDEDEEEATDGAD